MYVYVCACKVAHTIENNIIDKKIKIFYCRYFYF